MGIITAFEAGGVPASDPTPSLPYAMTTRCSQASTSFDQLKVGDRVEVEHLVTVGEKRWTSKTSGSIVRIERRRHGAHFQRNSDDKVYSDVVLLEMPDGELTAVTMDEFTTIRHV